MWFRGTLKGLDTGLIRFYDIKVGFCLCRWIKIEGFVFVFGKYVFMDFYLKNLTLLKKITYDWC